MLDSDSSSGSTKLVPVVTSSTLSNPNASASANVNVAPSINDTNNCSAVTSTSGDTVNFLLYKKRGIVLSQPLCPLTTAAGTSG